MSNLTDLQKAIDSFIDIRKVGVAGRSGRQKEMYCNSSGDHKHPNSQWTNVCHDLTRSHRNEEEQKWHLRELASNYLNRASVLQSANLLDNVKQQLAAAGYKTDEEIQKLSEEYTTELQTQIQNPQQEPNSNNQPPNSGQTPSTPEQGKDGGTPVGQSTPEGQDKQPDNQGKQPAQGGESAVEPAPDKPIQPNEQQPVQPQGEGQQPPQEEGQQPPTEGGVGGEVLPPEPNLSEPLKKLFDSAEADASEKLDKTKLANVFASRALSDDEHDILLEYYYAIIRKKIERMLLNSGEGQEDFYKDAKKYIHSQIGNLISDSVIPPEKEFAIRETISKDTTTQFHLSIYEMDDDLWTKFGIQQDAYTKLFGNIGAPWWDEIGVDINFSYIENKKGLKLQYLVLSKLDADSRLFLAVDADTGLKAIGITEKNEMANDVPKEVWFSGLHGEDADFLLQRIFRMGFTSKKEAQDCYDQNIGKLELKQSERLTQLIKEAKSFSF